MRGDRTRLLLLLLLSLSLVRGFIYLSVVPPWQAPDEPRHFEYVQVLYEKRRPLTRSDASPALQERILASMREHRFWRFGYAESAEAATTSFGTLWQAAPSMLNRPPLYYALLATAYALHASSDIATQLLTLRATSALLGFLTVLVAYFTAKSLFPGDTFMLLGVSAFVAFLPMFGFLSGTLNSDNLAILLTALVTYMLMLGLRDGFPPMKGAGILSLLVLGFLTKRTTLIALPLIVATLAIYLYRRRSRLGAWGIWTGAGLCFILLTTALGLFLSKGIRQGLAGILDRYLADGSLAANLSWLLTHPYSAGSLGRLYLRSLEMTFESFWGRFGWMNLPLDGMLYQGLMMLSLASGLGLILFLIRLIRGSELLTRWQKESLTLFLISILLALGAILAINTVYFKPMYAQGRYLFTALIPLATLLCLGLRTLIPARYKGILLALLLIGLFLFDIMAMVYYILPFYYG